MVITTKQLLENYKSYAVPKMKIKREIDAGKYFYINRGLYEDNESTPSYLLSGYIKSPSYISFEYALSFYGVIPESVTTVTSATTGTNHHNVYKNRFGVFSYRDVPSKVFLNELIYVEKDGYSYIMATKEKALCDYLYIREPISNYKDFKSFLFDGLRVEKEELDNMNHKTLIELSKLYRKQNLYHLERLVKELYE